MNLMFKEKIKSARKELGLTQVEFSKRVGISRSYLAEIERGSIKGSISLISKLSNATNKSMFYFMDNEIVTINSYDILDKTIKILYDNKEISDEGIMTEWAKEMLLKVLEKEVPLKIERLKKQ